jgi:hypothetical protein
MRYARVIPRKIYKTADRCAKNVPVTKQKSIKISSLIGLDGISFLAKKDSGFIKAYKNITDPNNPNSNSILDI